MSSDRGFTLMARVVEMLDSDLSTGQCYPMFEQPGPVEWILFHICLQEQSAAKDCSSSLPLLLLESKTGNLHPSYISLILSDVS